MWWWFPCRLGEVNFGRSFCNVEEKLPLSIAALPDLIAREAMLAITSGRASKMTRSTPIGQLTRSRIRPSSSLVRRVILPTVFRTRSTEACTTAQKLSEVQILLLGAK